MKVSLLLLFAMSIVPAVLAAGPREAQWRSVAEAVDQGLPRTAVERLQPILEAAIRDQAWAEAAKAIGRRVVLEAGIQGDKPEERVQRFQVALENAPVETRPILHALLAHAYWGYFEQNRYRIQQRTATPQASSDDFQTWDLPRLFREIDRQFTLGLTNAARLQLIPIQDYAELLEPGTMPDRYRPTLYDFVANDALTFFAAGEQAAVQPENAFVLEADSPVLGEWRGFLAWHPESPDTNAVVLKAISVYQDLLRFHERDPDPSAFLGADLERISFGGSLAAGSDKDERLLAALRGFAGRYPGHEISALAHYRAAMVLQGRNQPAAAHAEAKAGAAAFPGSVGGQLCRNLLLEIEAPQTRIHSERIWNAPWPTLDVYHKNTPETWFRIVAADWNEFLDRRRNRPENLSQDERIGLIGKAPVRSWSTNLPPTPDYSEHLTHLEVPRDLRPGFYFLLASRRADFGEANNEVTLLPFWVSDLALVVRSRAGRWEGFVLDAASGRPLPGATVNAWYLNQRGERVRVPAQTTDDAGTFAFDRPRVSRAYLFQAKYRDQTVAMGNDTWWGALPEPHRPEEHTTFFTDRVLYRPGQLIQYKGICIVADPDKDRYEPLAGRELTVLLRDPNGREIARAQHRANDFGSFAGAFTAPAESLTGAFQLLVDGTPAGATQIRVEEYKRPKFQVTLDAPAKAPRVKERVSLAGRAMAYTGAAVDDAHVAWRVTRLVRFPIWLAAFLPGPIAPSASQEIAHGTAVTRSDGSFSVEFPTVPDPAISESDEPVFRFVVHADITDAAGETRSNERTINVGYTALSAELAANDWNVADEPVSVRIVTQTLDEAGTPASGNILIRALKQPDRVHRARLDTAMPYRRTGGNTNQEPDLSDSDAWEAGAEVVRQDFHTGTNGMATNRFTLGPGAYRAFLETHDRFGKLVTARQTILVMDPEAASPGIRVPFLLKARAWSVEPGQEFVALWGTGYDSGRAFIEIERDNRIIERFWTDPDRTQQIIRRPIRESMRGGFTLHITYVRENRLYQESPHVEVPWTNKEFDLTWGTFRSKLEPGQKETWTATIQPSRPGTNSTSSSSPPTEPVSAEMVATLYDASLDAFAPFSWPRRFECFPEDHSTAQVTFANDGRWLDHVRGRTDLGIVPVDITYRHFPSDLVENRFRMQPMLMSRYGLGAGARSVESPLFKGAAESLGRPVTLALGEDLATAVTAAAATTGAIPPPETPTLNQVVARKNLQETAFFLPQLTSDSNGVVEMTFTMPEALTEWRFLGFAHDRKLRSGLLEGRAITSRDLMVQPNPPRFLRSGDVLEFTSRVFNRSESTLSGRVRLSLAFALNDESADEALGNSEPGREFEVPAKESRTYSWRVEVPDGCGPLRYKVVAASDHLSDGEEGYLPVLSRRVFVTESLPLPIRGPGTKTFTFTNLQATANSTSIRHSGLTVQMVSNPAWYAVLALPYLMEYPHECSEQVFNRYYANALARHIVTRDPRIRAMFDQWRGTPALDSPLEKNAELKSVALEETPWLRQARNESEARRNIALLFEGNRMEHELGRALGKLADMELSDGGWPWFPGGPRDDYITLYIVCGFGRLRHLGLQVPDPVPVRALAGLDAWMQQRWERLRDEGHLDRMNLDPTVALYLYTRAFFLKDRPLQGVQREMFLYWADQARQHWLKLENRQPQAHIALALWRCGALLSREATVDIPQAIVRSLRERAVHDDELGMYWREDEQSWWWYRAPIETQALMIELFDSVADDATAVEDLKAWLLKQKQTQDWKTTKATADSVYALLLRGADLLAGREQVRVTIGNTELTPAPRTPGSIPGNPEKGAASAAGQVPEGAVSQPEPGTGFYEARFPASMISPAMASIQVTKQDAGIAWGSVHWQYFEDLSRVRANDTGPLNLKKSLFTRVTTKAGQELVPVTGVLNVGDELVVRIELRVDRAMEYVHLKDQRGSGTEPVNVLSKYKFQDGLSYYESTRDTASHFFISYLPKGTYVFEYPLRIQHRGDYPAGFASVQCMYAPEFNSHSASTELVVK